MADYSEDERKRILDAMQRVEGSRAGTITKLSALPGTQARDLLLHRRPRRQRYRLLLR